MLKLLRNKKISKRIFYVLAVIIIPAFVIWGSSSVLRKDDMPDYAGTIFSKKVSFDDFRSALWAWKTQMKIKYGDKADQVTENLFNPVEATWDRLIILHEVNRRKIRIPDNEIISVITQLPFLQRNGQFDRASYEAFVKYGLNEGERQFEEQMRDNLAMAKLFEEVTRDIEVSQDEVKNEYTDMREQVKVKYALFSKEGYKENLQINDEELKAYYEKNKENFKVPPQVNAAYIMINFKENISDSEKTEELNNLKKTAAMAKRHGLKAASEKSGLKIEQTNFFGFEDPIPTIGWMPQISAMLFNLPIGKSSGIIVTDRGAYIFEISEKKDAYIPEFLQTKDKVKTALIAEKSNEEAAKKAEAFLDKAKKIGIDEAAKQDNVELKETPLFSRDNYIPELGPAKPLKDAAFALKPEQICENVIELQQGFCVIKSLELIPIDEEEFRKEKNDFTQFVLEQKREEVFNKFFLDLKKQANLVSYVKDDYKR